MPPWQQNTMHSETAQRVHAKTGKMRASDTFIHTAFGQTQVHRVCLGGQRMGQDGINLMRRHGKSHIIFYHQYGIVQIGEQNITSCGGQTPRIWFTGGFPMSDSGKYGTQNSIHVLLTLVILRIVVRTYVDDC
jgi:hypothetical protein